MPEGTAERIRSRLAVLAPLDVVIEDDSARHAGHPGAAGGGGSRASQEWSDIASCMMRSPI